MVGSAELEDLAALPDEDEDEEEEPLTPSTVLVSLRGDGKLGSKCGNVP